MSIKTCQCEHRKHFDAPLHAHRYQKPCIDVITVELPFMGMWELCKECRNNCYPEHRVEHPD